MKRYHRQNKNKYDSYTQAGRDIQKLIAKRSLPLSEYKDDWYRKRHSAVTDRSVEDRRVFHPEGEYRAPRSIVGGYTRFVPRASSSLRRDQVPESLGFYEPNKVLVCVRRKIRRQVLHAKGIAGGRGFNPPRFNFWSSVSCKE